MKINEQEPDKRTTKIKQNEVNDSAVDRNNKKTMFGKHFFSEKSTIQGK